MPIINFNSFGIIKQKKIYQKQKVKKYTTIVGEQIGICRYSLINKRFEVYIPELEESFPFTIESYKLGCPRYSTTLINNRITIINDNLSKDVKEINCKLDHYYFYLPFMAGVFIKGVLVTNNITNETEFLLEKTATNWKNDLSVKFIKEYIENYNVIINELRQL